MKHTRKIGVHTIVVWGSEQLGPMIEDLLDTLAQLDAKGPPLDVGTHIRYGWITLTLAEEFTDVDWLEVREPDFDGDTANETANGVNVTLDVLLEQGLLCKRLNLTPQAAWWDHTLRLAPGVLDEKHIYLLRHPPASPTDTGWYIGPVDEKKQVRAEDVERMPVWQLYKLRRDLMQLLALPVGYMATVWGTTLESISNPQDDEIFSVDSQ